MNKKMLDALTSAIYVSKLSLAGEAVTEDDQKIRAAGSVSYTHLTLPTN